MRILDIVLYIIMAVITFYGWRKGFLASLLQLAGVIAAFLLAGKYAPLFQNALVNNFGIGPGISMFLAYLLVIIIILLIIQVIRLLLESLVKALNLTIVNRILGAMFAFINGTLLFVVILTFIEISPIRDSFVEKTANSKFITATRNVKTELLQIINKNDIRFIYKNDDTQSI